MSNKFFQQKKEEHVKYDLKEVFKYELERKVKRKSVDQSGDILCMISEDNLICVHDRKKKESEQLNTNQKVVGVHLNTEGHLV